MAFDINGNKSSASQIAAQIAAATSALTKSPSTPAMPQAASTSNVPSSSSGSSSGGSGPWKSFSSIGGGASVPKSVAQSAGKANMPQQLPSWMGNGYSQVQGTDWYSTNPSNQNSAKYYADGRPVSTLNYNNQQTGQSYDGYVTPEQNKLIQGGSNNAAGTSGLISGMISSGQLNMPQSSIYKPGGAYAKMPMSASQATASRNGAIPSAVNYPGMNNNVGSDKYGVPGLKTLPGDPNAKPQFQTLPGDPNAKPQFQLLSDTVNYPGMPRSVNAPPPRQSGYTKNPTVDAMPIDQQLAYYTKNPQEAQQEIARAQSVGGPAAMQWANQLRSAISQSTPGQSASEFGNQQSYNGGNSVGQTPNGGAIPEAVTPAPTNPYGIPNQQYAGLEAQAQAQIDQQGAALNQSVNSALSSLKNNYEYTNKVEEAQRLLENQSFKSNNDPFQGATTYKQQMMEFNRNLTDTAQSKDYNSQASALQQKLADFQTGSAAQKQAIVQELARELAQFQMQEASLTGTYKGEKTLTGSAQDFNQGMAQKEFGLQEGQLTGNYDPYSSVKQQMVVNSSAWFNATPEERQRLAAENQRLGSSIGAKQDASGNWIMPQPLRTIQGQQLDSQEAQRQWDNAFKGKQWDYQMASDMWERTFKEKSFDQGVNEFAARMGLDYTQLDQNQQQFVAEMAFKNKVQNWNMDDNNPDNILKNAQIQELTTKGDKKLQDESKGLVEALRGGQMTPGSAIQQIDEDVSLGFYTPAEAAHLKNIITTLSPNLPAPAKQQQLTPEQQAAIPSNAELDKLYKTEGNGAPLLDWKSWYKDPKGKMAGVSFATWKQLYGPTLSAGK